MCCSPACQRHLPAPWYARRSLRSKSRCVDNWRRHRQESEDITPQLLGFPSTFNPTCQPAQALCTTLTSADLHPPPDNSPSQRLISNTSCSLTACTPAVLSGTPEFARKPLSFCSKVNKELCTWSSISYLSALAWSFCPILQHAERPMVLREESGDRGKTF